MLLSCMCMLPAAAEVEMLWHEVAAAQPDRHNAFTDLTHWKNQYWLCFRNGEHHVSMDGVIYILKSYDMRDWSVAAVLKTQGDDRDPHFTKTDDRLYCYFGVWDSIHGEGTKPPDRHRVRSHVAWTDDGKEWSKVHACWDPGFWIWRVREFDGVLYGAAYTAVRPKPSMRETFLLKSTDGYTFEKVSLVTDKGSAGEADFWINGDGSMTLVTRTEGNAWIYKSKDDTFSEWNDGHELEGLVHAPVAAFWGDRIFLAGRDRDPGGKTVARVWELNDNAITPLFTLPSSGDTSYCGLIPNPGAPEQGPPRLFVSWYSQHESSGRDAKVFIGEIMLD